MLFPAAMLVLMPKCPLCVAAYVAVFTGVGITLPTARRLRLFTLVCCWTALAFVCVRSWRVLRRRKRDRV